MGAYDKLLDEVNEELAKFRQEAKDLEHKLAEMEPLLSRLRSVRFEVNRLMRAKKNIEYLSGTRPIEMGEATQVNRVLEYLQSLPEGKYGTAKMIQDNTGIVYNSLAGTLRYLRKQKLIFRRRFRNSSCFHYIVSPTAPKINQGGKDVVRCRGS